MVGFFGNLFDRPRRDPAPPEVKPSIAEIAASTTDPETELYVRLARIGRLRGSTYRSDYTTYAFAEDVGVVLHLLAQGVGR